MNTRKTPCRQFSITFPGRRTSEHARSTRQRRPTPVTFESLEARVMLAVSNAEQSFVYELNRARHSPTTYQTERGLTVDLSYVQPQAPLAINTQLMNSSEFKSAEMPSLNYFRHTSPTGETPNQLVRRNGYDLPYTLPINGTTYTIETVGNQVESLAAGTSTADQTLEILIVDANTYPPGHRNHLLGIDDFYAAAREIGVGYTYSSSSNETHYWAIHATQSNDPGPYLTGVVFNDSNANRRFNVTEGLGGITVTATGPMGTFSTSSLTAGGWALKVPAGQYIVSASGGSFTGTSSAAITVGTDNMEVDFVSGRSSAWVDFAEYVNAAPVLSTTATPSLPPVVIGTTTPRGGTVGSLLGTALSDVNPLASRGIAVTAATPGTASGAWQYSLDEGATWLALGSPTATAARLLRAQDLVRFVPTVGSAAGTANISYRGWDQTSGTVGSAVDVSTAGGSSAFSSAIATATASAVVSNTAPVLAGSGAGPIAPVAEDSTGPAGTTVAEIMGTAFSDVDPGTPAGLAVTGVTGDTNGTWSYSLDEGQTWSSVGSVSQATAIPLRASDRLRFVPNANFNGTATVTYRGWDQSACVAGVRVNLTAVGLVGGTGPCSTGSVTATATVTPVNDAPGYVAGRSSLRLKPLAANTSFDGVGTTISELLGNCGSDVDTSAVAGIALIGLGSGGSYYWNTGGNSWGGGTVSPTFVTLLRGTDRLGFTPNSGFTGESTVTFRLWDQTTGLAGFNEANLSNPSQSTGGTTAFGTDILTARIFVGSAGTAPTASFGTLVRATDGRSATSIPVTFSRAVEGLDTADFRLTCNGSPVSLAGATLTGSGTSFVLGNLDGATSSAGDYVVSIVATGSGITDTVGGRLAVGRSTNFTVAAAPSPPTDIALSASSVAENAVIGTVVGTLSTTDVDAGSRFTYILVAGTGSTDNASFSVVGNTIKTAASFNYEAKTSYSIRVRSADQTGLSTERAFTISVANVNETPTDIALSATSIAENKAVGAVIGTLSTTDSDSSNTFTYTLVGATGSTDNASFTIVGGQLLAASSFNFEAKSSYSVRVRSTDQGGLFTEKQFTITVTNVNETPGTPTGVTVVAGGGQVSLSWTAPRFAGDTAITDYVVKYSSNGGSTWTTFRDPVSTATSSTVTGLTNGTSYVIKVIAKNAVGISLPSASSAPATPAATVPGSPTSVIAVSGNTSLAVTWTAPASTGGSAITD